MADGAGGGLELRRFLQSLRRRKHVVWITSVVCAALAVALSTLQTRVYEGDARVLLQTANTATLFQTQAAPPPDPVVTVATEIQVLQSSPVRASVAHRYGNVGKVHANRVGETMVIAVHAPSTDRRRAAAITTAYARAYIAYRRSQAVDELLAAGGEIQGKINDLQKQIDALGADADPAHVARRDALVGQQAQFSQRLDELQVQAPLSTGGAQLVAPSPTPTSPVQPKPVRNGVIALLVGAMLGIGLAALLEYLDESLRTRDDLAELLGGLPVLGVLPVVPVWRVAGGGPHLMHDTEPGGAASEAFRSLRTSLQLIGVDAPLRTVQFTSASAGEGKTTTTINLSRVLRSAGLNVIVVDCDLRQGRVHEAFGVDNHCGFSSVVSGHIDLDTAIVHEGVGRPAVLPSGPPPPNPSELLSSPRTAEVLRELATRFDFVLIDSPPVLPVTDAAVLARLVDGVVVIAAAGVTRRQPLQAALSILRQVDAPIIGAVLNRADTDATYGYGYGYGYRRDSGRSGGVMGAIEQIAAQSAPPPRRPPWLSPLGTQRAQAGTGERDDEPVG